MKRVLIVGGVAGGASCAARARRLSETAKIVLFDRGPFVSFANCGLPYYVGKVITEEKNLLVASPELFHDRFNIDVRVNTEILSIDKVNQRITARGPHGDATEHFDYDALVLATGAYALRPPLPGLDLPGIFALRTIPDSNQIRNWIQQHNVKSAVVVGAGFVGLEMAENLIHRGIETHVIEMASQVMPPLDPEMASPLQSHIEEKGVKVHLSDGVTSFRKDEDGDGLIVTTTSGQELKTGMVILGIGVRPETTLAKSADLQLGSTGGVKVDNHMRTSDPNIFAVGDMTEQIDFVTRQPVNVPLAGPANRQGRIAADAIFDHKPSDFEFRGIQGTAVCGVFDMVAASTGPSEKTLQKHGMKYAKLYLHPGHHVSYYPGSHTIHIKVLYHPETGLLLGGQAVGEAGAERRIDVLSMAIQKGATIHDLAETELCYAPQFGSAKDPLNMAGFVGGNDLEKDFAPLTYWEDVDLAADVLLDVRTPEEFSDGHAEGALNIPLENLRERLAELAPNKDQKIKVYCKVGQRAYYSVRILRQNGYNAFNVTGGFTTYCLIPGMKVI